MSTLSAFLLVVAVFLTLPSPTGQLLKCPSGRRIHRTPGGPDSCEECVPGTFMNVSEHSELACYSCSTCPAGHVGRPCNATSDTVCCPYPDMTVMDTEVRAYCVIPANHTTTHDHTHQGSECGGTHNTSGSAALDKPSKDIIGLLGHILAVMLALPSIFVLTPPQVPRYLKWFCIICMATIIPVSLIETDEEDMVFLIFMSFSFIYCVVFKTHRTFLLFYYICKKTNDRKATEVLASTRATSSEADEDTRESQSSDPLVTGTEDSYVAELSSQDDPSLSPGGSSNKHDSDDYDPGATGYHYRSDSRHEPLSAPATGRVIKQTSPPTTTGSSDMSKHAQASDGLPGSGSCISTETTTLSSSTVDIHTVKVEISDDDSCVERTELSHDQLALKMRSDTSQ